MGSKAEPLFAKVSSYIITSVPAVSFPKQLDPIVYDLRFTWRGLCRDRAFTLTAIAMLMLAIALNVTVFAVMDTMLFRGLPLARSNRLVYIQERHAAGGGLISYADFENWRTEARSFEGLAFVAESAIDRKSTRLNSSHEIPSRMPSSA